MRYPAVVTKEGKNLLADFPTCPGCQTPSACVGSGGVAESGETERVGGSSAAAVNGAPH